MRRPLALALMVALQLLALVSPVTAQGTERSPAEKMARMINAARLANGQAPLAWNPTLAEAARLHAEDIARGGTLDHTGSDGSSVEERVGQLGYAPYPDGIRASENWSTGSALEALAFFLESELHRGNVLSPLWREIGVGRAEGEGLGELWVVVFGAQPGVLPITIDDEAPRTTRRQVTVTLSTEGAGWDEERITLPVEVRVAPAAAIEVAPWQPWQPQIEVELPPLGGEQEIIAEYRDAEGRLARASDTIFLLLPEGPLPTGALQLAPTLTPSVTPSATATATATATPTPTPTPTATPTPTPFLAPLTGGRGLSLLVGSGLLIGVGFVFGALLSRLLSRR